MLSLLVIIMLLLLTDFPQKLKLEKIIFALIILFYINPNSPQLEIIIKKKRTPFFIKLLVENKKCEKTFFKVLERQNLQNETMLIN